MPRKAKFAVGWGLALAPVLLFIPAVMLAGMGPCGYARPWVMVAALAIFVALELAAVPCFIRDARLAGRSIPAMFGISLSLFLLVLSAALEFLTVTDYL
jgi:hypothetical protein